MKINIFEGARRLSVIAYIAIVIVGIIWAFNDEPYVSIRYRVPSFGVTPIKVDACDETDEAQFPTVRTSSHRLVHVTLCFAGFKMDNSQELVFPYARMDDKNVFVNSRFSDDVSKYTNQIARSFDLSAIEKQHLDDLWKKKWWSNFFLNIGYTAIAVSAVWLLFSLIGWVVRGFLGIPKGHDSKLLS